jgi:hypothetical protein
MTNSLERIFDGLIEVLQTVVMPEIRDESVRAQAYGAIDLLRNLKPRVQWAADPLYDDVAQAHALSRRIAALVADSDPPPPPPPEDFSPPSPPTASGLEPARDRLEEYLCAILRWMAEHPQALPRETVDLIETAIRDQQRVRLKREIRLTAPILFGEISRGG